MNKRYLVSWGKYTILRIPCHGKKIYKWQRGETLPTIENLVALSCIVGVRIDEILAAECRTEAE